MARVSVKSLTRSVLGLFAGTVMVGLVIPQATLAQFSNGTDVDPVQNMQDRNNAGSNPMSQPANGQPFNVFNLIHNSKLSDIPSMEDFNQEQRQNIDDAAAAFREKQRTRLQGTPEGTSANSETTTTPQAGN